MAETDSDPALDLEGRELCSDGACTGVVGPDGRCKPCGRSAAEMKASAAPDSEAEAAAAEPADVPADLADRELCADGACVGIIGPDGRCKVCGLASNAAAEPST